MENPFSTTDYNDSNDISLIESALSGDIKSLNNLLKRHQDFIYNVALKMLNNTADAEDVTQEILIKIVTQLAKYDKSKAKFRTWLYRITFNHILNLKKNQYETIVTDFSVFFQYIESTPDLLTSEAEERELRESFEESKVACMAGMLMCLDRIQRLVFIVGELFEIDHILAAELFEISPDNFRKKLSRARKDLYQWMNNRCGLVNLNNPCRCKSKTKGFIQAGYVDPKNLKWHSDYQHKIREISETKLEEVLEASDIIYKNLYREHPFKTSLRTHRVLDEILNNRNFTEIMKLN